MDIIKSIIGYLSFVCFIFLVFIFSSLLFFVFSLLVVGIIIILYNWIMIKRSRRKEALKNEFILAKTIFERWNYLTCASLINLAIYYQKVNISNPFKDPGFRALSAIFIISSLTVLMKLYRIPVNTKIKDS